MRFKLLSPTGDARFIHSVRKAVLISIHANYEAKLCIPLASATYLALETKDGIVGMAEAIALKNLFPLITTCPFRSHLSDELVENYNHICHLRTIYVYPEFRKSFNYLYLALGITSIFSSRHIRFATAVTSSRDPKFANLYRRTGGKLLGNFSYASMEGEWLLYGFRAEDLLAHPQALKVENFLTASNLPADLIQAPT